MKIDPYVCSGGSVVLLREFLRDFLRGKVFAATLTIASTVSVFVFPGTVHASTCDGDGGDYRRLASLSLAAGSLEQAKERLSLANDNGCLTPSEYLELGKALASTSAFADAADSFQLAQDQADTADLQALAIGRYAEALAKLEGPNSDSLDLIQFARRQHSNAPSWMTDLSLQLDTALLDDGFSRERMRSFTKSKMGRLSMSSINPISRDSLDTTALAGSAGSAGSASPASPPPGKSSATAQTEKSLSFRVNFARGSSQLAPKEIAKVRELAEGMDSEELRSSSFELVGHTDVVGEESMNQRLSEQRSAAVYQLLVALKPSLAGRLSYRGMGESAPLYVEAQTSTEHLLNRRVQVVVK